MSTSKQEEADTIESQLDYIHNHCPRETLDDQRAYYLDKAQSAYKKPLWERPQGKKLLEEVQPGDVVVVFHYFRLGRKLWQQEQAMERLVDIGARIYSVQEQRWYDDVTPTGIFVRQVMGAAAEHDRNETIEDTRKGLERLARAGMLWPTQLPLGYDWSDRYEEGEGKMHKKPGARPVVVLQEAELVRLIFDLAEEMTQHQEVLWLNEHGKTLPCKSPAWRERYGRTERPFDAKALAKILSNELYTGYVTWGKTTRVPWEKAQEFRHYHPELQIISFAQFNGVHEIRKGRRVVPPKSQGSPFVFSGLLRCPYCNGRTVGKRQYHPEYEYQATKRYVCRAYAQRGKTACKGWDAYEQTVKKAVIPFLAELFERQLRLRSAISQEARLMELEARGGQARALEEEKARAERDIRKAQEGYQHDIYTAEEARRIILDGRERMERAEKRLAQLERVGTLRDELKAAVEALDRPFREVLEGLPDAYLTRLCHVVFQSFTIWKRGYGNSTRAGLASWEFTPELQVALADVADTLDPLMPAWEMV